MIWTPSPNYSERALPVSMLVMHYTGMESCSAAIERLADSAFGVSAHYVVAEDGQIVHMVDEAHRAHHAGVSFWQGTTDINSASIGIEICNPGHEWGYRPFPEIQMQSVLRLAHDICTRHTIMPQNVVGHSDIAPSRKEDPGELFDWELLARLNLAVPRPHKNLVDPGWNDAAFMLGLERYGYAVDVADKAVIAFQRRFRPENIDGVIDGECRALLWQLLLTYGDGSDIVT